MFSERPSYNSRRYSRPHNNLSVWAVAHSRWHAVCSLGRRDRLFAWLTARRSQQLSVCRSGMQKVNDSKVRSELMSTATLNVTEYGPGHVFRQNREQEVPRCERLLSV